MAPTTKTVTIEKIRQGECYFLVYKRFLKSNPEGKSVIENTEENFYKYGLKLEVFITKADIIYTDLYDVTFSSESEPVEASEPKETKKQYYYSNNEFENDYKDWEKIENENFSILIQIFKDKFSNKKFSNHISLDLTLDFNIENIIFPEDLTKWFLSKFTSNVSLKSLKNASNTLMIPNSEFTPYSLTISGFDVLINTFTYFNLNYYFELSFVRLIGNIKETKTYVEMTVSAKKVVIKNTEIHGYTKLIANGVLDSQSTYQENTVFITGLIYKIMEIEKTKTKNNLFKISNFYNIDINYVEISKEFRNSCFFYILDSTNLNISNYKNKYLSEYSKGSELLIENIRNINFYNCELSADKNRDYVFAIISKAKEDASISVIESNFTNINAFEFADESFGKILISSCNIISNNIFKTFNFPIYKMEISDSKIDTQFFELNGIINLNIYDSRISIKNDTFIETQKFLIDNTIISSNGNLEFKSIGNLEKSPITSSITNSAIECKDYKVSSEIDFNVSYKLEDTKIYCSNYTEDKFIKSIMSSKVIIKATKYNFNSDVLKSNTDEFYIRADNLLSMENSFIMKSKLIGKITFDLENHPINSKIYLDFIGDEKETTNSSEFIFNALSNKVAKKEVIINSNNYFIDSIINSFYIDELTVKLMLKGEKVFSNNRLFYKGENKIIYKIDGIESSDVEKIQYLSADKLPTKDFYKFLYGVINVE